MLILFRPARLFMTVVILWCSSEARAQVQEFKFSANGQFLGFADMRIEKDKPVHVLLPGDKNLKGGDTWLIYSFTATKGTYSPDASNDKNTMHLSQSTIYRLNRQLAARIDLAVDNLTDSVRLVEFYETQWGKNEYTRLESDLESASKALKDTFHYANLGDTLAKFPELQELKNLEDSLKQPYHPYTVGVQFNSDSSREEIYVGKTDRLRALLANYWIRTLNKLDYKAFAKVNRPYREDWDQIGPIAQRAKYWYDVLIPLNQLSCTQPANLDSMMQAFDKFATDTLSLLRKNPVVKAATANAECYKSGLWWNYGFFSFNPLGFTTAALTYHVFLFDKEAARLHDEAAREKIEAVYCCTISINGIDSVILVRNNGVKIFSTDTTVVDPVWGFNDLHALRTAQKVVNQFEVPVTLNDCRPQYYLQFDAAHNYYADSRNKSYKRMTAQDSLSFVVHNIPANTTIVINQVSQTTTNTSSFQDVLAGLASVSGLNTASGAVSLGLLNPPPSAAYVSTNETFFTPVTNPNIANPQDRLRLYQWKNLQPFSYSVPPPPSTKTEISIPINIQGRPQPQTLIVQERWTSKDLLKAYLTLAANQWNDRILNFFFEKCHNSIKMETIWIDPQLEKFILNYLNEMLAEYYPMAKANTTKLNAIHDDLTALTQFGDIAYLSMITDRSLPPPTDSLSLLTDSTADFRSQIFQVPVYDSTRAVQATIVAKKITKKDTTTITHPIYPSVRIGTLSMFAFSAGIAVTPGFYYFKVASSSGGQLTVTNNASLVSYLVGLHFYPCKYFQLDNSFLGIKTHHFWQRFSIYAGLGLPDPLQEYYGGASFDLVPGFKLITGAHLFLNNRYEVVNNQVANQASAAKYGGVFFSFSIDPSAFVTVLGLFK
jgi:hypothetical protein